MRKLALSLLFLILCYAIDAQIDRPKLVVGIVVDQMKYEYLMRYSGQFSEGGFKRLLKDGFTYRNAHYTYIPTKTGPGHASIFTGTTPARHGIIGNDIYVRRLKRTVNCVEDGNHSAVGGSGKNGANSPVNMLTTTVTDELRLFTNFQSKVIGLSIKDRGAILPSGHNPTGAYWYDNASGMFITSTYYRKDLPAWVNAFNDQDKVRTYFKKNWDKELKKQLPEPSIADKNPYESEPWEGSGTTFPYKPSEKKYNPYLVRLTPYSNTLLREFAEAAIAGESLGADPVTDFLTVSFSATDDLGHPFGPRAQELQDLYRRLDLELEAFLTYLDEKIGSDNYMLFLTADHGVADVSQYLVDSKMPGGYYAQGVLKTELNNILESRFGIANLVERIQVENIYFNHDLAKENDIDLMDLQEAAVTYLNSQPFVSEAQPASEIAKRKYTDPILLKVQNGYHANLSGDIVYVLASGYLENGWGTTGTDHRAVYTYDTHVPIIFYGKSIPSGESVRNVDIVDIAPTVSTYLNISLPSAAFGQPLIELFE